MWPRDLQSSKLSKLWYERISLSFLWAWRCTKLPADSLLCLHHFLGNIRVLLIHSCPTWGISRSMFSLSSLGLQKIDIYNESAQNSYLLASFYRWGSGAILTIHLDHEEVSFRTEPQGMSVDIWRRLWKKISLNNSLHTSTWENASHLHF